MPQYRGIDFVKNLSEDCYYIENNLAGLRKRLSPFMWKRVLETIKEEKLPTTIVNNDFGFGIALEIYLSPKTPGGEPILLAKFDRNNIPKDLSGTWDEDLELMQTICNVEENLELVDKAGLLRPGDKEEYVY